MIDRNFKALYYTLFYYPMKINGQIYKCFKCPSKGLKVHLGPGQRNYLNGWLNVDANIITAKSDLWINFLDPLPFKDNCVDIFYSYHVVEHLPEYHLQKHFNDMFKALRPGGGLRIGVPSLGNACRKYVDGDHNWFYDFPDKRKSIGGRFTTTIFCRGEHLTALDESYLSEIAEQAGFIDIQFCLPIKETSLSDLGLSVDVLESEWESDFDFPHTVVIEAKKPS